MNPMEIHIVMLIKFWVVYIIGLFFFSIQRSWVLIRNKNTLHKFHLIRRNISIIITIFILCFDISNHSISHTRVFTYCALFDFFTLIVNQYQLKVQ